VLDQRLSSLEEEYEQVERDLAEAAAASDANRLRDLSRRHKELGQIVATWRELRQARADHETAEAMLADTAGEDREMVQAEIEGASGAIAELEDHLQTLLLPRDPNAGRNVII